MGKLDSFAETVPTQSGPATENQEGFGGGTVQASFTESVSLSRNPIQLGVFTDQSMGTLENSETGTVPLKRQPHRGYESGVVMNSSENLPGA